MPMKLLSDFFPVLLFFLIYKFKGLYFATGAFICASFIQIGVHWYRFRRFEQMHIITFVLGVLLGGATLLLHDELFIKWKPTAIYWAFAIAFIATQYIGEKPLIKRMLEDNIKLPPKVWTIVNISWAIFFTIMGILNLYVVYNYTTNTWVNFKFFGIFGLTIVFVVLQALCMGRYVINQEVVAHDKSKSP